MERQNQAFLWNMEAFYPFPDSSELTKDFDTASHRVKMFREKYLGKISSLDVAGLLEALTTYESLYDSIIKPQCYGHLLFAADSENDINKSLSQKAAEFSNLMSRELLFLELEIMHIPDDQYQIMAEDPCLSGYCHYLENVRKFRPYTLSEQEESLVKRKNLTGVEAFSRLFDELSASLRYRMEVEGKEREYTGEELLAFLHHHDANLRERGFSTFLKRHEEHGIIYSSVFNNIVLDHSQEMELRGYGYPMEMTNLVNEIPAEVVEHLMRVSEENYPLAQDYFRLKAKLLKIPRLKNTDVYAPVGATGRKFTFDEARDIVLEAYGQCDPEFKEIVKAFFTERRVDVFPRPGKSGGAFCMGMTPSLPPYVLLNFTENLRDVATIAHELGHGLHFVLAGSQRVLNYHPTLPLSETASVFGEMLLTRYLLERETDTRIRISLLCAKIEDIIATTFRQNVLTRFEERLYSERKRGLLTSSRLCDLWWEENARLYGDAVEMIKPYRWGWSYISHFIHARFYCYSYVFAELLVLSLYRKYLEEGSSFIPTYRGILASGGSKSPADTVKAAGIDLADPAFWQKGYDFLKQLIEDLKALV